MGWVIVEFPESREVFLDDRSQGNNRDDGGGYRTLIIEDGVHTFRLGGTADVTPASQEKTVTNTSALRPLHVIFTKAV
jgi:hypothetical protein